MKKASHDIAIQLSNVSKRYTRYPGGYRLVSRIHHEKPTLVEKLVHGRDEEFWALKDINLTIKKGERVGIIGPNGSGKTTLLKIIAGITTRPTGKNSIKELQVFISFQFKWKDLTFHSIHNRIIL